MAGAPPGSALPVSIEALVGSRWRPIGGATTDAAGAFATSVAIRRSRLLRVRFAGLGGLRASTSQRFPLRVRPVVSVSEPRSRVAVGRYVRFSGTVSPRKRLVSQVLQQRRGGRWRTVGTRRLRVSRDGSFRGRFAPLSLGAYRFYVVAKRDRATARGASRRITLTAARRGGGAAAP